MKTKVIDNDESAPNSGAPFICVLGVDSKVLTINNYSELNEQ